MKKTLFVQIIAYFFILLFLYTGVAKLMDISQLKEQLASSPLTGSMAGVVTWVLPIAEILIAVGLFIPVLRMKALYATVTLMSLFTVYVVILLFIDSHLTCSCGGIIEELTLRQHVVFNAAAVSLSVVAISMGRSQPPAVRRKWVPIVSIMAPFVLIAWTLFSALTAPSTVKTGMEGTLLPSFDLLLPDSLSHLNTDHIPAGKPFVIVGFDPFCTHCQAETADILRNIQKFKNIAIYYVTPNEFWKMRTFYKHFRLDRYPNITVGNDYRNAFFQHYMTNIVPYTAIFDSKKRLKQVFAMQTDAKNLANAINE